MEKDRNSFENIEQKFEKTKRLRTNLNRLRIDKDPNIELDIKLEKLSKNNQDPEYILSLSGDGKVRYEGKRNVRVVGIAEATVDRERVTKILDEMDKIYFFSLEETYLTDSPQDSNKSVIRISVILGNDSKEVVFANDQSAPTALNHLADLIDTMTNSQQWVH